MIYQYPYLQSQSCDKEIITFKTIDEFNKKAKFLLENPRISEKLAENGYKRFMAEHDSKVRLEKVLGEINVS